MIEQPGMRSDDDRERRSVEERRAQLVQAALEVISADGLTRATTRRITDHAGLALGAFHYAFRSKDELLEAVVERLGEHLDSVLRSAVHDPNVRLAAAVEQLVSGYWDAVERSPDLQLARYELGVHALREPKLREVALRQQGAHVATVAEVLAKVVEPPDREQREELARFLLATMDGLILQWLEQGDQTTSEERVALATRCMHALLPDAA